MNDYALKIAILMTCHNRKEKTLKCLNSLYNQINCSNITLVIYLVDDGSTDGTAEAVINNFTNVEIIQGDGTLFWCGGMRLAWQEAIKNNYDGYIWLNDDVELFPNAIECLLVTWQSVFNEMQRDSIIIGSCIDGNTGEITYGGYFKELNAGHVPIQKYRQACFTMNGNLVFIPRSIAISLGNLSSIYTHAMGDMDYGIRASKKGYLLFTAPGFQGKCEKNLKPEWLRSDVPFIKRWKIMNSPKGLPVYEYMHFRRICGTKLWFLVPIKLFFQVLFPGIWKN